MNRTIEQWQKVDCEHVAKNASPAHVMYLLQDAVQDLQDLQELARQLETERASLFAESQRKQQLDGQVAELVIAIDELLVGADAMGWSVTKARAAIQQARSKE